jgi:hypothetical protein
MMLAVFRILAIFLFVVTTQVEAKTRIIVLPSDAATNGATLLTRIAESVVALPAGDQLLVYSAQPVSQIAAIGRPTDPTMNSARIKAVLAAQFKPVKDYLSSLSQGAALQPPGNLMIPALFDELGRNLLPGLPEKGADILLVGSLFFWDQRDARSSTMVDGYVPSDGTLRAPASDWPFSIVGAQKRLAGITVHFCSPDRTAAFASAEHELRLRRFWSLWTTGQAGMVGTFSTDLPTCFRRFNAGDATGQTVYEASRDLKPEMLRVTAREPATLPLTFDAPGRYFLRDDMPISLTPPSTMKGIAWIGIKWNASSTCDLDLYARGEASNPWLYFGSGRTAEGWFNKDFTSGTGETQFEYIEFRDIDLGRAEAAINLYSCDASSPPEGRVRIWFSGRVYEAPFKLATKSGNRGAMPIASPHWLRIDLKKVVGLIRE